MPKTQRRALDLFVAGYVMAALLIGGLIARGIVAGGESELELVRQDARRNAEATAAALAKEIGTLRHTARLFVREKQALFARIVAAADPDSLVFDLDDAAGQWLPGALAFTIADGRGNPIVSDFKGSLGPACLADLKRSVEGTLERVPLHGIGSVPHIDIAVPLPFGDGAPGAFMASFTLANFATAIAAPTDLRYLVEFVSGAPRDHASVIELAVPGSDVVVRGTVNPAFVAHMAGVTRHHLYLYVGAFALFALLGGVVLWRARRRILDDAATLQRLNDELEQLSRTDPLTGLANRRLLRQQAAMIFAQADREQKTISLALFDLDHFKRLNDQRGHAAGDAALVAVGQAIAEAAQRPLDLAVRYGGEEFLICWYDTGREQAAELAAGLAVRVHALPERHADGAPLTVSAGIIVRLPDRSESLEAMLKDADEALYRAKEGGRDRIEFA